MPDRLAKVGDRLVVVLAREAAGTTAQQGGGAFGIDPYRLAEVGDGPLVIAVIELRTSPFAMERRVRRLKPDGRGEIFQSFLIFAALAPHETAHGMEKRVVGVVVTLPGEVSVGLLDGDDVAGLSRSTWSGSLGHKPERRAIGAFDAVDTDRLAGLWHGLVVDPEDECARLGQHALADPIVAGLRRRGCMRQARGHCDCDR